MTMLPAYAQFPISLIAPKWKSVRNGPLLSFGPYRDTKDPCPVFDGQRWHIFGSGGSSRSETWDILHATAAHLTGPWKLERSVKLIGDFPGRPAAPGVIYDQNQFHMFLQTDHLALGGPVMYLTSSNGEEFTFQSNVIQPVPDSDEAGIYDPHPAIVKGKKVLTYSGTRVIGRPDIYLAESLTDSWQGPWQRRGKILKHEEVPHHNQRGDLNYEWGLEGSQLIELPNGKVLLNAVCFLPQGQNCTRQRVFFAIADKLSGPYRTLGPVLAPMADDWGSGENGHAAAVIIEDNFYLFYQARSADSENTWRYGLATISIKDLEKITTSKRLKLNHLINLFFTRPMLQKFRLLK